MLPALLRPPRLERLVPVLLLAVAVPFDVRQAVAQPGEIPEAADANAEVAGKVTGNAEDAYVAILEKHGLRAEPESLAAYLRSLRPDAGLQARMETLVVQLGDDDFFRRETAMSELVRLPSTPVALLQHAADGTDPEVRWRAGVILYQADARSTQVLHAAFHVIRLRQWSGLAEPLLGTIPLCRDAYLRTEAERALQATARPADAAALRTALRGESTELRVAAVLGLDAALGAEADDDLLPLLTEPADEVRLAAAVAVAGRGQRTALAALIGLLESEQLPVRTRSDRVLRALTGQQIAFVPYESPENRQAAVASWRQWLDGAGRTAELVVPIPESEPLLGRTLICFYNGNRVVEVDAQGQVTWELKVPMPYGCHGLPNGHRLVASYTGRMVAEYDATGKEIWKMDDLPASPFSVRRLPNGHTLVACSDSKKVIEVTSGKTIVWETSLEGRPMDARRLENGHTLVTLQNGRSVVEVDRAGKVVATIGNLSNPLSAQRLENGNTLVCQMGAGRVSEFDAGQREVWSKAGLSAPHAAQRLPNGNTLIIDSRGAHEFDTRGHTVWQYAGPGAGGICRY